MRSWIWLWLVAVRVLGASEAPLTVYKGLEDLFRLSPPAATTPLMLRLDAESRLRSVLVRVVRRQGATERRYLIMPADKGFTVDILLEDGPGVYDVTLLGSKTGGLQFTGLVSFTTVATGTMPEGLDRDLGPVVLAETRKRMGKTVGRGECWDLAQEILDEQGASWTRPTEFGRRVDPRREGIRPGDIIQMYGLVLTYPDRVEHFGVPQHTAVVAAVEGSEVVLWHQNVEGKRFVMEGRLDLSKVTRGRYEVYRPVKGLWRIR